MLGRQEVKSARAAAAWSRVYFLTWLATSSFAGVRGVDLR
jgi:hypothetical protein